MSELVTNVVLHARSPADVTMRLLDGVLWVGVSDGHAGHAVRKRYGTDAATGRGLLLVERIATEWGTEPSDGGKLVWFQLAPGTGETAMVGAETEFAADLAELTGEVRGATGAPGSRRHDAQASEVDGRPANLGHRLREPRASRSRVGRRATDRTTERIPR